MQQTVNFLRGSVEVDIEGAFPERFLNICAQNGIEFWGLRRLDGTRLRARVHRSGWRKMPPFALRAQCRVSAVKQRGVPAFLRRYRRRHGFILGFLLTVGVLYGLSQFVWEFEVTGNELVSGETILRHLADIGVKPGIYGPSIDIAAIKNEMLLRIDELSWLTVNRNGSHATVEVRERIPKPDILPADQPCNIVAAKDGLILRVDTRTGEAQVKAGETVTKGQLIVSGVVDSKLVGARFLHAQADVYARTWYELQAKMPLRAAVKRYTGRSRTRRALVIAGYRINFSFLGFPSFENCDKIVKTTTLRLPFGVTLPVSLVAETYIEYERAAASVSKAAASEFLKASLTRRLNALLGEGEVLTSGVTVAEEGGALRASLTAECQEQIALTVPLPR
jgi:similar to stage IV sporulation protein